jgi:hypothetical protein
MNCPKLQKVREEFHLRRRTLQQELFNKKKTQQQTVSHIRRLKKVRRKFNAIADKHGIKLNKDAHRESIKNLSPKEKFLQNLAHRHFVYCLNSVEGSLVAYRGLFHVTSAQTNTLKKELSALHRDAEQQLKVLTSVTCEAGKCASCLKFDVVE